LLVDGDAHWKGVLAEKYGVVGGSVLGVCGVKLRALVEGFGGLRGGERSDGRLVA
jgi:hypothetical protein